MSFALIFRNKANPNLFRDSVLAATGIPGITEIIICSGFFQNRFKGSAYCVSHERNLAKRLVASKAQVVTVGVHNASWKTAFEAFNADLMANGVNVNVRLVKSYHWHAKVLLVSTARGPVFGAIGSSNLTRNAFSTTTPFNYEADTLFWVPQARGISAAIDEVIRQAEPADIVRAAYSNSQNSGLTIRRRLADLRQQVLDSSE